MREIKFRAWHGNVMVYAGDGGFGELKNYDILKNFDTVMQYTGLKDKNGKEIYEGDIISYSGTLKRISDGVITGSSYTEREIIWVVDGWGTKVLKSTDTIIGSISKELKVTAEFYKIIGNIHENKELLEL